MTLKVIALCGSLRSQSYNASTLRLTLEYNRSYSPAIKNALDWGSRPEGKNKWGNNAVVGSPYSTERPDCPLGYDPCDGAAGGEPFK